MSIRVHASAIVALVALTASAAAHGVTEGGKQSEQLRRGAYLATYGGCNDCHTPKVMSPQGPVPYSSRLLAGHPQNQPVPPIGSAACGNHPGYACG